MPRRCHVTYVFLPWDGKIGGTDFLSALITGSWLKGLSHLFELSQIYLIHMSKESAKPPEQNAGLYGLQQILEMYKNRFEDLRSVTSFTPKGVRCC